MTSRQPTGPPAMPADELRRRLDFSDAELLADCQIDLYRSSGPGGQHRNKVSSAVRLRHRSGLVTTGTGSRSQHENKAAALSRLREAIALAARVPLPQRVAWPENVTITDQRLRVSERNPSRFHVLAIVLDALAEARGELRPAAERLGLTPTNVARFLHDRPKAWTEANRIRAQHGHAPLKTP